MAYPTQAYNNLPAAGNPRNTEGWALIQAARRLSDAQAPGAPKKAIRDALRLNWRLWTIFQAEMVNPESPAPQDLRENILTLCQFIDKHTVDAMIEAEPEKLNILIEINRNIAAGLLANPGEETVQSTTPVQPVGGFVASEA